MEQQTALRASTLSAISLLGTDDRLCLLGRKTEIEKSEINQAKRERDGESKFTLPENVK